jgi:BirA family biotin operon repressor/biotin-[acetyl-CoA-carboxylase] ligase
VGGVLGETTVLGDLVAVIIGLGINVNMPQDTLDALQNKATSLSTEAGHPQDIDAITEQIHTEVCTALDTFIDKGFAPFIHDFRSRLVHRLGDTIEFHIGNQVLQGTFHSINDDGTLNLILDGSMRTFASGEMLA